MHRANSARQAWILVMLLWPVALLNYLDRQMLSSVRSSMKADIPSIASEADFGVLLARFLWVYGILSPVGGLLGDFLPRRLTVVASLVFWSLATTATGYCKSLDELLVWRSVMGASEAFYFPAALALIADFHHPGTRSRAIGLHQTGVYVGQALGGVAGYIADLFSWRYAFIGFGAVGMIYGVVLFFFLQPKPADTGDAQLPPLEIANPKDRSGFHPWHLFGIFSFWLMLIYFTLPAIGGWTVRNWLPTYLGEAFNLRQGPAGLAVSGYITLASIGGAIIGGFAGDLANRFSSRGRMIISAIGCLAMVPALLMIGFTQDLSLAIFGMVLFGIGWGIFDTNNMPILVQFIPGQSLATAYGLMNCVSICSGAAMTEKIGAMRDAKIPFSNALAWSAGVTLLASIVVLAIKPRKNDPK